MIIELPKVEEQAPTSAPYVNQLVRYEGFPQNCGESMKVTRINFISECGKFARLDWLWHMVSISDLKFLDEVAPGDQSFWDGYADR